MLHAQMNCRGDLIGLSAYLVHEIGFTSMWHCAVPWLQWSEPSGNHLAHGNTKQPEADKAVAVQTQQPAAGGTVARATKVRVIYLITFLCVQYAVCVSKTRKANLRHSDATTAETA